MAQVSFESSAAIGCLVTTSDRSSNVAPWSLSSFELVAWSFVGCHRPRQMACRERATMMACSERATMTPAVHNETPGGPKQGKSVNLFSATDAWINCSLNEITTFPQIANTNKTKQRGICRKINCVVMSAHFDRWTLSISYIMYTTWPTAATVTIYWRNTHFEH